MRRVLTLTTVVCALSMTTVALFKLSAPASMAIGFIGRLSTPPIQPAVLLSTITELLPAGAPCDPELANRDVGPFATRPTLPSEMTEKQVLSQS